MFKFIIIKSLKLKFLFYVSFYFNPFLLLKMLLIDLIFNIIVNQIFIIDKNYLHIIKIH